MNITDIDEPPSPPILTVRETTLNSAMLEWNMPENTGPDVSGYSLQYRKGNSGGWTQVEHEGTGRSHTLEGLQVDSTYQATVQARNEEGSSDWSDIAQFTTNANQAPVFGQETNTSPSIQENAPSGMTVTTVTAEDPEGQSITFTLGPENAPFGINGATGVITTLGHQFDHESEPEHRITITARDTLGGSSSIVITVTVTNVDEDPTGLPEIKGAPHPGSTLSADLTRIADPDGNPEPGDMELQWLLDDSPIGGADGATLTLDDTHLGSTVSLRVTFTDGGGFQETLTSRPAGPVARAPVATTPPVAAASNQPPAWQGEVRLRVDENHDSPIPQELQAEDPDQQDSITGIRMSGADAEAFDLEADPGSGTLSLSFQQPPDHERPGDQGDNNVYEVTLRAASGEGEREMLASASVTIEVLDTLEPPEAPTGLRAKSIGTQAVTVSWHRSRENGGPPVSLQTLRFRLIEEQEHSWSHLNAPPDATSVEITGLLTGRDYAVQIRSENQEGSSEWSPELRLRTGILVQEPAPTPTTTPRPPSTGGGGSYGPSRLPVFPKATPTPAPTATIVPTVTPVPTATVVPTATSAPTATPAPTAKPEPTPEPTAEPTGEPEPTPTMMPEATTQPAATATPTATPRPTPTPGPTAAPEAMTATPEPGPMMGPEPPMETGEGDTGTGMWERLRETAEWLTGSQAGQWLSALLALLILAALALLLSRKLGRKRRDS